MNLTQKSGKRGRYSKVSRRFYRAVFILSAFIALFVAPERNLFADDYAGKITRVQGKVTVRLPGWENITTVKAGDSLAVGGVVETAKNSGAQLIFTDGAFVSVLPETALRVNQYSYTPEDKRSSAIIRVLSGRARFVVYDRMRGSGSRFVVETEHAFIGAGVSDFFVSVSPEETEVAVIGSSLGVRNISSLVVGNVGLGTNQKTVVREKTPPSQPSTIPAEQRRKYIRDADI